MTASGMNLCLFRYILCTADLLSWPPLSPTLLSVGWTDRQNRLGASSTVYHNLACFVCFFCFSYFLLLFLYCLPYCCYSWLLSRPLSQYSPLPLPSYYSFSLATFWGFEHPCNFDQSDLRLFDQTVWHYTTTRTLLI